MPVPYSGTEKTRQILSPLGGCPPVSREDVWACQVGSPLHLSWPRDKGQGVSHPARQAQAALWSPPRGDRARLCWLAGLCSEHFYGLLIVMPPFNSGCHSLSAKSDRLGFMPPNYGAWAVQR